MLHVEDKVSIDFLMVFRSLTSSRVFACVTLMLLVSFQLDTVSPFVITVLLVYANNMVVIIVTRDLIPKPMLWRSSVASKFGLILKSKEFLFSFCKRLEHYPSRLV